MAKSQITLFKCPSCGGSGQVPVNRHDSEKCDFCSGKGKVSTVVYRDYVVIKPNDNCLGQNRQ